MLMYYAKYTVDNLSTNTITRGLLGTGQELKFTIYDEDGDVVDLTSVSTNMKLYVGTPTALQIDGGTLTAVSLTAGTVKYPLVATNFDAENEAGTYTVELQFANNADVSLATSVIRAGDLTLKVIDTISD